jgi:HEAT repeat protein
VAAEVLAYSGEEGYQLLKEGYESDNLVLRRAVVFGLKNVKQQWAREMLENIAVRDAQWVVRNAAAQALETFNSLSPYIPSKLPAPAQAPWLIAFAARQGVGVPPDKVPIDMLFSTLAIGTQEERIAALTYLRLIPNDEVIRKIYSIATSEQGAIKDAALLSLWYLRISGARLSVIR